MTKFEHAALEALTARMSAAGVAFDSRADNDEPEINAEDDGLWFKAWVRIADSEVIEHMKLVPNTGDDSYGPR